MIRTAVVQNYTQFYFKNKGISQRLSKRKIAIVVGSVIFAVVIGPIIWDYGILPILVSSKYSTIEITGTIDYTGIPEQPDRVYLHGFGYLFTPDAGQENKVGELKHNFLPLVGESLEPELEEKHVMVQGIFVEQYKEYAILTKGFVTSSEPWGPAIVVKSIKILN